MFKHWFQVFSKNNYYYFSGMKNKNELGKIILMASNEKSEIECAEKFLELIKNKI